MRAVTDSASQGLPVFSGPPVRELSPAAKSMWYFAFYVLFDGLILLAIPETALRLLGQPEDGAGWLRVLGMVVAFLGWYYLNLAKMEATPFFRVTTHTRMSVPFILGGFVAVGSLPAVVLLFGVGDFAGGLWTWIALRRGSAPTGGSR